ncbi:hypothetical protein PMHK_08390 [Pseudomonas sp. MHK4]
MLAKNLRAPRGIRHPASSLTSIASKLLQMTVFPCRSELAREKPEGTAGYQAPRVIVDLHREQAPTDDRVPL